MNLRKHIKSKTPLTYMYFDKIKPLKVLDKYVPCQQLQTKNMYCSKFFKPISGLSI